MTWWENLIDRLHKSLQEGEQFTYEDIRANGLQGFLEYEAWIMRVVDLVNNNRLGQNPYRLAIKARDNTGKVSEDEGTNAFEVSCAAAKLAIREAIRVLEEKYAESTLTSPGELSSDSKVVQTETAEHNVHDIEIFISHSHVDVEIAKKLITLLKTALLIPSTKIRATSVDGYRFPPGTPIPDRLRSEIHQAKVLIAILTPNSMESIWVLFELGARWGADKQIVPLAAKGIDVGKLEGPLSVLSALRSYDEGQLLEVIDYLGVMLDRKLESAAVYKKCIEELAIESSV